MKKLKSLIISFVIFLVFSFSLYMYYVDIVKQAKNGLMYYNVDERNSCYEAMNVLLEDDTALILGSSELSSVTELEEIAFPPVLFQVGNSDFNMILDGRGYMQSISHAINVGALSNGAIKNDKVVIILSPQWFSKEHINSDIYASRFSERMYLEFLENDDISLENKIEVANRIESLLTSDPKELEVVKKYREIYIDKSMNLALIIEMKLYSYFNKMKGLYDLVDNISEHNLIKTFDETNQVKIDSIDWNELMITAEINGDKNCTTNEFGVYDSYFTQYIKDSLVERKDSSINGSYSDSIEYSDFCLFLDICKDVEIEPLVIMVPVNGYWYDYIGFPKEGRDGYYDKIREICSNYNVELADFSNKEYEKYFLRDIMHLGWKGWVYLDEAIYKFYKK